MCWNCCTSCSLFFCVFFSFSGCEHFPSLFFFFCKLVPEDIISAETVVSPIAYFYLFIYFFNHDVFPVLLQDVKTNVRPVAPSNPLPPSPSLSLPPLCLFPSGEYHFPVSFRVIACFRKAIRESGHTGLEIGKMPAQILAWTPTVFLLSLFSNGGLSV